MCSRSSPGGCHTFLLVITLTVFYLLPPDFC